MTAYFFAYGTLMSLSAGRPRRPALLRLLREANSLGAATTRGRLYDLGAYPGLVASEEPSDVVHGELYELRDPTRSFRWLDTYEGRAYERLRRPAFRDEGEPVTAWVYAYRANMAGCKLIASGRWLNL